MTNAGDDDELETPVLRPLVWMGNAKRNIQAFPEGAQKIIGDELQLIQFGGMPKDAKPFKGVGSGVFEIALRYDAEAYRTVLAVQLGEKIYVLHAFQKKSKKGIKTTKHDVELIKSDTRKQRSGPNMKNDDQTETEFEEGSGNVFADLELVEADELFTRAKIGFHVYKIIEAKKLKQKEIASLLAIKQPEVSHLMNGHFNRFTTDKLLDFLKRLDRKVTIQISPHKPGEPYKEVGFSH